MAASEKRSKTAACFRRLLLDKENDIGLTAVNPLVAQLLLNAAVPSSITRINLLAALLYEFPWDPEARPIDAPEQALLIHVIRSISPPSGSFQGDYQRTEDLRALAEVFRRLREDYHAVLPTLLLVEGIVLRHIGRRLGNDDRLSDALSYFRLSRTVLEMAREILSRRRPSPSRNFEISMILTAIATTIGHAFNVESRVQRADESERRELVQKALDTASESRAYTEAYHPLDTAFWTNRDFYRYLLDRPDTQEVGKERQAAPWRMRLTRHKSWENCHTIRLTGSEEEGRAHSLLARCRCGSTNGRGRGKARAFWGRVPFGSNEGNRQPNKHNSQY